MWFGGFGFYVSIVVPIGTDILGSALEQGVITRRVTVWINIFNAIAIGTMLLESLVSWNRISGWGRITQVSTLVIISISLAILLYVHPILDGMFDVDAKSVDDSVRFYNMHRIYLWTSTVQWLAAWIWLYVTIRNWTRPTASN